MWIEEEEEEVAVLRVVVVVVVVVVLLLIAEESEREGTVKPAASALETAAGEAGLILGEERLSFILSCFRGGATHLPDQ